jgi:hypothetical protein
MSIYGRGAWLKEIDTRRLPLTHFSHSYVEAVQNPPWSIHYVVRSLRRKGNSPYDVMKWGILGTSGTLFAQLGTSGPETPVGQRSFKEFGGGQRSFH